VLIKHHIMFPSSQHAYHSQMQNQSLSGQLILLFYGKWNLKDF